MLKAAELPQFAAKVLKRLVELPYLEQLVLALLVVVPGSKKAREGAEEGLELDLFAVSVRRLRLWKKRLRWA